MRSQVFREERWDIASLAGKEMEMRSALYAEGGCGVQQKEDVELMKKLNAKLQKDNHNFDGVWKAIEK